MKKNIICLLITIVMFSVTATYAAGSGAQNITTTINTARFILFSGTYLVSFDNGTKGEESGVFKLDTYTGKVWFLKVEKNGTKRLERWVPVEDWDAAASEKQDNQDKNDTQKNNSKGPLKTLLDE